MTPQEKAWELTQKYMEMQHYLENDAWNNAKQCAIIAVNEMLIEYPSQCPKDSYEMVRHLYWQEVKKEIEKI